MRLTSFHDGYHDNLQSWVSDVKSPSKDGPAEAMGLYVEPLQSRHRSLSINHFH